MNFAANSQWRISPGENFKVAKAPTVFDGDGDWKKELSDCTRRLYEQQRKFYADGRFALLLVFQAMDAAGKDSTIRHVFTGVNPAGFSISSFKQPTEEELGHDFLWRHARALPKKGYIGIFNRSHYEEALVVRVHPEYLAGQGLIESDSLWRQRFDAINAFERNLTNNNTVVLKFWLNVSQQEQHARFRKRLENPNKFWKFSPADLQESERWKDYMFAYEQVLQNTSTEFAPWYAIPADDKKYMRYAVADIVSRTLDELPSRYPEVDADNAKQINFWRSQLLD